SLSFSFLLLLPPPPLSTLFPYTTLFRSAAVPVRGPAPALSAAGRLHRRRREAPGYSAGARHQIRAACERRRRAVDRCARADPRRSEEHTSELQSLAYLVCRLLLEKKKKK